MNLSDIQGLVFHAYRRHPYAQYVLLRFQRNSEAAIKRWLAALVESRSIDSATPKDAGPDKRPGIRVNIAFSYTGLVALGLPEDTLQTFPMPFIEGLGAVWQDDKPDHRSRILGDVSDSAPHDWAWGYQGDKRVVDALLLVFGTTRVDAQDEANGWIRRAVEMGAIVPDNQTVLCGTFPDDQDKPVTEPFGFVDGISQPLLRGARGLLRPNDKLSQPEIHELEDGEMLLGHRDGARQLAVSPTVAEASDPKQVLPEVRGDAKRRDLGYNGTYLVFRQIAQEKDAFEAACKVASKAARIPIDRFKALLVGRWQDGSPLIKCPIAPDPSLKLAPAANDFVYRNDPYGERCPIGAHVRRANPRDSLGEVEKESWRVSNRHRILRRGRPYEDSDTNSMGIHFICLNADIARQFEFIQQNWINNPTFGGLHGEKDPLVGAQHRHAPGIGMAVGPPPESPVSTRVTNLAQFTHVRGGGYFFLPSLKALRFLAQLAPAVEHRTYWKPEPAPTTLAERVRFLLLSRFPILLALILVSAPLMLLGGAIRSIARPMFQLSEPRDLFIVTTLASLAAAVAFGTFQVVQLYAKARFDVQPPLAPAALTWRRTLKWQVISLPIVGAALALSAADAATASSPLWEQLVRFGLAALGGYVAAFVILFLATAARERSVQLARSRDTLPSSGLHAPAESSDAGLLLRLRNSFLKRMSWFVEEIQKRVALLPAHWAAGYIDSEARRILPGHIALLMLLFTIGVAYFVGWWVLWPPSLKLGFQLPPLAYLLFALLAVGAAGSGAAFFLDRYRVPLLTAVIVWLAVLAIVGGTDHEFEVSTDLLHDAPSIASMLKGADDYQQARDGTPTIQRPVVVVAAGGGGAHQAAWTARVLAGLTELWGPAFSGNVRLISAVSAGSVGTLHYVNQFSESGPPVRNLQAMVDAAKGSATGDIWWGLAYPDLVRSLLPFRLERFFPGTRDRGWALDQAWRRALGLGPEAKGPTVRGWQEDGAAGWRPAVAFNALIVETGERVVLATYGLPETSTTKGVATITRHHDLSMITAARLSAAFPYVTPFARANITRGDNRVHLADGGYWDNFAVVSALEWLRAAAPLLANRNVLLIQIPPSTRGDAPGRDRAWVWQLTAPLAALETVRTNAQGARNKLEVDELVANWNGSLTTVTIPFGKPDVLLSWHLSRRERCDIERVWRNNDVSSPLHGELAKIDAVLGPRRSASSVLPTECRP